jgi:uncharacterized protein
MKRKRTKKQSNSYAHVQGLVAQSHKVEGRRYAHDVSRIDLRHLRLGPGETRRDRVDLELQPFLLGGQRYEPIPSKVVAELEMSEASGATAFGLRFESRLAGPCMRCLGHAEVGVEVAAHEFHDPTGRPDEGLRSEYVVDELLEVGGWARDAIAFALPEQILCSPDCAGLCPTCGKDLNVEPHEHVDLETDPRWAPLEELRERL